MPVGAVACYIVVTYILFHYDEWHHIKKQQIKLFEKSDCISLVGFHVSPIQNLYN